MALAPVRSFVYPPEFRVIVDEAKASIVRGVSLAAPGARVEVTPFFNHSFLPDVEIVWPLDHGRRAVYYRAFADYDLLAREIRSLAPSAGIVHLEAMPADATLSNDFLETLRAAPECLVLQNGALEALVAGLPFQAVALGSALLRIGRGFLQVADVPSLLVAAHNLPEQLADPWLAALGPFAPAAVTDDSVTAAAHGDTIATKLSGAPLRESARLWRGLHFERRPTTPPLRWRPESSSLRKVGGPHRVGSGRT